MQKILCVCFLLAALTSKAYESSNFGYLPLDWYKLPEESEQEELENDTDNSHNLEKLSRTLKNIVNANSNVLERVKSTQSKEWNLSYIRTSLAVSSKGLVGVLSLKGMSAVKLYWRPVKKTELKKEKAITEIPTEIVLNNSFGKKEIKQAIQPALQRAIASGKIKNISKFEQNLVKASEDFHFIISGIDSLDQDSRWWVRALLLELSVTASGNITPATSLGSEVRIRLRWQRIQKITTNEMATSSDLHLNSSKNNLTEFIYNMANDLEQSSEKALQGSSFRPRYFRIGLGLGIKGNIVVAKSEAKVLFYVMFERNSKATKKNTNFVKEKTSSYLWVAAEHQDKNIKYAKNNRIDYQENFIFNESTQLTKTTKNVIYKVKRKIFRKGLEKAYRISRFFVERAEKSPGKKWELFCIETQFEMSITGFLGLTSLSGLGATRMYFYKEER